MRKKLLIGSLVALGWVLSPLGASAGDSVLALDCPPTLGVGCTGVGAVYGTVCYGTTPIDTPTIAFVTVSIDSSPSVECPV